MNTHETAQRESAPCWKKDFPIRQSAEHEVSRRQFARVSVVAGLMVLASMCFGALRKRWFDSSAKTPSATAIARMDEMKVGGYKLFFHPLDQVPAILVRLETDKFVALSQSCTHLQCPAYFQPETKRMACPCHEGFFSAEDGRVLAGPPQRPLTRYPIEVRNGQIWLVPSAAVPVSNLKQRAQL